MRRRPTLTPCAEPGCPELLNRPGRCPAHGGDPRKPTPGRQQGPWSNAEYRRARRELLENATVCEACGDPPTPDDPLTADHAVSALSGGSGRRPNLRALHRSCNSRKGAANA